MARRGWIEGMTCICGKSFRTMSAEAFHRHNFPIFCKKPKEKKPKKTKDV